jgi:predicted nucleic acid-binding protein
VSESFVIDCSIAMAWCFGDEATPKTSAILDRLETDSAVVPGLWFLEVANVLAIAEKRKRIGAADSSAFLSILRTLDIAVDTETAGRAFDHLLPLCRKHGLTSYDAAYLDLAIRRNLPLASLDTDLRAASKRLGIELLGK